MNFFLATMVLLAGAGDVRLLVRGLSTTQRIARDLWRMCFAVHCLRIHISGAATAVPQVFTSNRLTLAFGRAAADIADFLDNPPARYQGVPGTARFNNSRSSLPI
jgi:hypothetical protein